MNSLEYLPEINYGEIVMLRLIETSVFVNGASRLGPCDSEEIEAQIRIPSNRAPARGVRRRYYRVDFACSCGCANERRSRLGGKVDSAAPGNGNRNI